MLAPAILAAAILLPLHPLRPGGRQGSIVVRLEADGLHIEGKVDGPPPSFAASPSGMGSQDHVEVWLAPPAEPVMPPVGWGTRFGPSYEEGRFPRTAEDCQDNHCREWFRAVPAHRERVRRMFVRQCTAT